MLCECFYGLKCELPLLDLVLILQSLRSELLKYGSCCISFVWQVEALFDAVRHAVAKCPKEMTDLPGSAIHLYEVLYIGKVVVSTKKAPPSFIDDAVAKFDEVARQVEKNLSVLYMLTSVYETYNSINCTIVITFGFYLFDRPIFPNVTPGLELWLGPHRSSEDECWGVLVQNFLLAGSHLIQPVLSKH